MPHVTALLSGAGFSMISQHGFTGRCREVVTLEDFEHFFEPTLQGREEAARAFSLFDWDNTGMVDREQVRGGQQPDAQSHRNRAATVNPASRDSPPLPCASHRFPAVRCRPPGR